MFSSFANIWNHPKTSAAGVLIALVTCAGVLSQQGVTLGSAGTGTVVSLISGLAAALLGLLARDPANTPTSSGTTAKLGAWALIALLLPLPFASGCSGVTVAQDIVNWTPALQSSIAVVGSTASVLDPAAAPVFAAATNGFDAASNVVVAQAKAYLANPNATVLAQLQTAIVTLQQQVNTALLQAGRIVNPASQQKALADVNAVGTVVNAILALVASISSKAAVAQMAAKSTVKLAQVLPYRDQDKMVNEIAAHYSESVIVASFQVNFADYQAARAGF